MLEEIVQAVQEAAESLGPLSVAALAALDNLGLPKSGEVAVETAAATLDHPLPVVMAFAALGAFVGDNFSYWLGRGGGSRVLRRLVNEQRGGQLEDLAGATCGARARCWTRAVACGRWGLSASEEPSRLDLTGPHRRVSPEQLR